MNYSKAPHNQPEAQARETIRVARSSGPQKRLPGAAKPTGPLGRGELCAPPRPSPRVEVSCTLKPTSREGLTVPPALNQPEAQARGYASPNPVPAVTTFVIALLCAVASLLAGNDARAVAANDARQFESARARVVRSAVDAASPAIVTIETVGGAQPLREGAARPVEERFRMADGPTTGLILTPDGLILASTFNFARDPSIITVRLSDGRRFVASLLARDHIRRLALLRVEAEDLPAAQWVSPGEIEVGQYALACGMGLGSAQPFASLGIVSAVNRRNGLALQTDAKTSPINYGGPLIDIDGRVLGLIVPMAGAGGGTLAGVHWYDSGIGFAVTRNQIDSVLERLRKGENIEPGKIGVLLTEQEPGPLDELFEDLLPRSHGVRIAAIADPSPAKNADLQIDDVITAIDGLPVADIPDLQRKLSDRAAGETVTISIKRRWRSFEVSLSLSRTADLGRLEGPPPPEPPAPREPDQPSEPDQPDDPDPSPEDEPATEPEAD